MTGGRRRQMRGVAAKVKINKNSTVRNTEGEAPTTGLSPSVDLNDSSRAISVT
jgi:hypothetical protein